MDIIKVFENSINKMQEKNWDCIYVMIDLHGTIFKPSYAEDEKYEFYPDAEHALHMMSQNRRIRLILWTSTDNIYIRNYLNVFENHDIHFDAINGNPYEETTETKVRSMSFKEKPYFNVGIDDKFGFEPETDWTNICEWYKKFKTINND